MTLINDGRFSLPLTQSELADGGPEAGAHKPTLQQMKADGLISLDRKQLTIHLPERLIEVSGFSDNYLHLDRRINK